MSSKETLEQVGSCWEGLEDRRRGSAALHDFLELLLIALCCTLKGTIVTADALNCQRAIAEQIVGQKGDYALALKFNRGTLFDDVVLLLDKAELQANTAAPVVEADHGRIETRTATVNRDRPVAKATPMAGPESYRQSGSKARNGGEDHDRNCLLPAQSSAVARAAQPGDSTALEHRKQPALAAGRGHERGSGSDPNGTRTAQSRRTTPLGHQRHAKRRMERLLARKVQACRLGRRQPLPPTGAILICDCPASVGGLSARPRRTGENRDMDLLPELEEEDYYLDGEDLVFTAAYHLKRGACCGSGCRHCPYGNGAEGVAAQATHSVPPLPEG